MKTVKTLKEERGVLDSEILELRAKYEGTDMTKEDAEAFDALVERMEALGTDIESAEKREKSVAEAQARKAGNNLGGSPIQGQNKEDKQIVERFDLMKAINAFSNERSLTGVEKEMVQEGINEVRSQPKIATGGMRIVIRQRFMEKRTDIDQTTSGLEPTFVGGYTDALRENAVYLNVPGINRYQLTGDFKLPVTTAQTLAWATAENSAAADGGSNFTSDTLTPFRLAGFVDISNKIDIQNGPAATQAIMKDLGRAEAALINRAMFGANVADAPPSLPATSGVLTFTENAVFANNVSVFTDVVKAEQTLVNDHGLGGQLSYVYAGDMLSQIKQSVLVAGLQVGMGGMTYNDYQTNNYLAKFTGGATTATGFFGDFSRVHFGRFGGLNILVDPFTVAGNDQIRLVVNSNVDWSLVQGAAFVKWTSLLA